jgi:hypothetical protein
MRRIRRIGRRDEMRHAAIAGTRKFSHRTASRNLPVEKQSVRLVCASVTPERTI